MEKKYLKCFIILFICSEKEISYNNNSINRFIKILNNTIRESLSSKYLFWKKVSKRL